MHRTNCSASADETITVSQRGWKLDIAMPAAYHPQRVVQQCSIEPDEDSHVRVIRIKKRFLDQVKAGRKTLELRVGYPNILSIQPGQCMRMLSGTEEQVVTVNDVRKYTSHAAMFGAEDCTRIVPDVTSRTDMMRLLQKVYPPDKKKLGVVILDIEAVTQS
jgi:ASC-1-like (ASCH) protein